MLSPSVENLVAQLTRLPGIGSRTAQRLAFHILQASKPEAAALADAIHEVKERVRFCRECGNLTEEEVCAICLDGRRDRTMICVVEAGDINNCSSVPASRSFTIAAAEMSEPFRIKSTPRMPVTINHVGSSPGLYR